MLVFITETAYNFSGQECRARQRLFDAQVHNLFVMHPNGSLLQRFFCLRNSLSCLVYVLDQCRVCVLLCLFQVRHVHPFAMLMCAHAMYFFYCHRYCHAMPAWLCSTLLSLTLS